MRNVIFVFWVALLLSGCRPARQIEEIGEAANKLHLIPFQCTYLGFPIAELDGCWIACPGAVFHEHDLATFSQDLDCGHPQYDLLRCGLEGG